MFELIIIILLIIFLISVVYYIFFSPKSQLLGKVFYRGNQLDKKVVALTFDDGPNEPYTSQILDILRRFNIKATFFPVGENIARDRETLKKIIDAGHIIGNHSYSHALFAPIFTPSFKKQISMAQQLITDAIGKPPTLFRPPWFFRTTAMLKTARTLGLITITGTFASYWEVFKVSPQKIAKDAIRNTRPGTILVFHDGYNNKGTERTKTVEAMQIVIPQLLKAGYKFVTVPQLLKIE
jgi:peptidoglycan/xylan/chitin deacetylase (PgdA/CDA1 family)